MHPIAAWMVGAAYISYRYGYKCQMLPLPKRYIALTSLISIAALVSMANENVGALFGYGSLLAMFLYQYRPNQQKPQSECDKVTSTNIASGKPSSSQTNPPSVPNPPHTFPWA